MLKTLRQLVICLIFSVPAFAQTTTPTTGIPPSQPSGPELGRAIMLRQEAKHRGYGDEKGLGKLVIKDAGGHETVRAFEYKQLEEKPGQGIKSLIRILAPANLKGTGLLTHQNSSREDDQWIYLPALKKTNRIVGGARKGRFIGSDFTYEDLSPKTLSSYDYSYVRDEPCSAATCHVIDSTPKDKGSSYSKTTLWIQSDTLENVQMDLFDGDGKLVKRARFEDIRAVKDEFTRAHKITMEDLVKKGSSQLVVESVSLKNDLSDADFTRTVLER